MGLEIGQKPSREAGLFSLQNQKAVSSWEKNKSSKHFNNTLKRDGERRSPSRELALWGSHLVPACRL